MENNWISVKERLPEKMGYYLGCITPIKRASNNLFCEITDFYESVKDGAVIYKFQDYITHWMPLPEPPKPIEE